nr:aminopeptidase B [Saccharomyces cerevisiae, Peptide Partial, 7 aa] [Saccharomyces cerevisiae]
QDQYNIK